MKIEQALKLVKNPVKVKRRKGLKFIIGNFKYFEKKDEIFNTIRELSNDDEWSIRALALKGLVTMALQYRDLVDDSIATLKKALNDENENVRSSAIDNFVKLLKVNKNVNIDTVKEFVTTGLNDENVSVINSALRLLMYSSNNGILELGDYVDDLLGLLNRINNVYTRLLLIGLLTATFNDLKEDIKNNIIAELKGLTKHEHANYRANALQTIGKLLEKNAIREEEIRDLLIKRLRDTSDAVKKSAIDIIWSLAKVNPVRLDQYLEIIIWEILIKTKNKKLRLHILEFLDDVLTNMPRELMEKYDISRALDIIEKNTVPKSQVLKLIKAKSNEILEAKIGLSIEDRIKKF
ncbi:MAG: hypothetical protein ACP6IP_00025 [Candidatus Njordarchaeia archaeon]